MPGMFGTKTKRNFETRISDVYTEPNTGCWLWAGPIGPKGYGSTYYQGKRQGAHRASFLFHKGLKDTNQLHVLHKCDVPLCINPEHLYLGTQEQNVRDRDSRGRNGYVVDPLTGYSKGGRGKLHISEARSIKADTRSWSQIAAHYGVSRTTVQQIKNGSIWKILSTEN